MKKMIFRDQEPGKDAEDFFYLPGLTPTPRTLIPAGISDF
jgi:hypothetical protein